MFTFDAEHHIASVDGGTTATYTYDAHNFRVKKVAGAQSTVYIFSRTRAIAEYVNGTLSKEYIYARSQLLATEEGGTTQYHHSDHLSVRLTTDANGNVIGEQGHYPFGESWYQSGTTSPFVFTTYQRDLSAGLDYAVNRFYSHRIGRFQTTDPLDLLSNGCSGTAVSHRLFSATQNIPADANRYAYVINDPTNRTDSLGLFHLEICDPFWDPWCIPCPWWDPLCSLAPDPIDFIDVEIDVDFILEIIRAVVIVACKVAAAGQGASYSINERSPRKGEKECAVSGVTPALASCFFTRTCPGDGPRVGNRISKVCVWAFCGKFPSTCDSINLKVFRGETFFGLGEKFRYDLDCFSVLLN